MIFLLGICNSKKRLGDRNKFIHLVYNLVTNACKFTAVGSAACPKNGAESFPSFYSSAADSSMHLELIVCCLHAQHQMTLS